MARPRPKLDAPSSIYVTCPDCREETLHHVLKGRMSLKKGRRFEGTVECGECKHVHRVELKWAGTRDVPTIVSRDGSSEKKVLDLPIDETMAVDDEVEAFGGVVRITAIEANGRRVKTADVPDIDTLWAMAWDLIKLKFTVYKGRVSKTMSVQISPEEVVTVGQEMDIAGTRVTVRTIKTVDRTLRKGNAEVRDIRRVYATEAARTDRRSRERFRSGARPRSSGPSPSRRRRSP